MENILIKAWEKLKFPEEKTCTFTFRICGGLCTNVVQYLNEQIGTIQVLAIL